MNRGQMRQVGWGVALAAVALLIMFGNQLLAFVVDWLWFGEVGQQRVFWTVLATRAQLALLFGVAFFLLAFLNIWLARRNTPPLTPHYEDFPIRVRVGRLARTGLSFLLLGGSLVAGLLAGIEASSHWDDFIRFRHPVEFGQRDPVFERDLGFYIFRLPFLTYLYQWSFLAVLLVTITTGVVYYFDRAIEVLQGYTHVATSVRVHLSVLLGILVLVKAWGYRLDAFELLYSQNGSFWGAGYTDLNARLLALNLLTGLAVIAAIGFFANTYIRALWLPGAAVAMMLVASLLIGGVYPGVVQRITVQPNELQMEQPYIQRHLAMTRAAYGLDQVTVAPFGSVAPLAEPTVDRNQGTVKNTRLWDYRPLRQTFQQLQRLKPYYTFPDVDVDRYTIGNETRQVMVAAREIQKEGLPAAARRWVNEWLEYTHGYGFVMIPVNEVTADGAPLFWAGGAPQRTPAELKVTRPQIYFGQVTDSPAIAPSETAEFDHPDGPKTVRTRYTGTGGVPLNSTLRRMLFAAVFGQTNILISKQITPDSRILFHRRIDERAARIAPFLSFDHDAYLVVANGGLYWVQDAYTTTRFYPYSVPAGDEARNMRRRTLNVLARDPGNFNYVRNSVKIVTSAYDGSVKFYVADPTDPLIRSYQAAFPSLFVPLDQMPQALRSHLRYPEGLFTVQAGLYTNYHVTDAATLFTQSDQWKFPTQRVAMDDSPARSVPGGPPALQSTPRPLEQELEPFYVSMRLPDEEQVEFILMMPFQIERPPSMPAWLCARSDGEYYGRLLAFTFPQGVDGPTQAESFIDQNPEISSQLTLWDRAGSRVFRGGLLALPMEQSILYVKPIYLVSEANSVPRLTRVIIVNEGRAVMAPTLGQALTALVQSDQRPPEAGTIVATGPSAAGQTPARPEGTGAAPPSTTVQSRAPGAPVGSSVPQLIQQANQAFEAATEAQRRGDWAAYGAQLQRLQSALRELQQQTGAAR